MKTTALNNYKRTWISRKRWCLMRLGCLCQLYLCSLEMPICEGAALIPCGSCSCHKGHRWEALTAALTKPDQTPGLALVTRKPTKKCNEVTHAHMFTRACRDDNAQGDVQTCWPVPSPGTFPERKSYASKILACAKVITMNVISGWNTKLTLMRVTNYESPSLHACQQTVEPQHCYK